MNVSDFSDYKSWMVNCLPARLNTDFFSPILFDIFHTEEYINLSFLFMRLGFNGTE